MPKKSGIDTAWEILFERHHILERIAEEGRFVITSAEINTVKEARLMAKFDRSAPVSYTHLCLLESRCGRLFLHT